MSRFLLALLGFCLAAGPLAAQAPRTFVYGAAKGLPPESISLDLYKSPKANAPIMIYVHGGGWRRGDKANKMDLKPAYFAKLGFLFASVNYRLADGNNPPFPGNAADVAAAVKWMHTNGARYGGDPSRIFLIGHSAGAHLASLVATDASLLAAHGLKPSMIAGVITLDTAAFDITPKIERGQRLFVNAFGTDLNMVRKASPISHLRSGQSYPSFFIVMADDRADEGRNFMASFKKVGGRAELLTVSDMSHEEINSNFGASNDRMTQAVTTYLTRQLGGSPAK